MSKITIAFVTSSDPRINPSSRFRVFQLLPFFEQLDLIHIVGITTINTQLRPYHMLRNMLKLLQMAHRSDILFVQKARLPEPLVALLTRLTRVIYDFDDSTFLPPPSWPAGKSFESRRRRLDFTLQRSHQIIAGNDYLAAYAGQHSEDVSVIPTVVTTDHTLPAGAFRWGIQPQIYSARSAGRTDNVVIGWIGGGEHVQQLDQALAALRRVQQEFGITVRVVSDRPWLPEGLVVENKPWRLEDEVDDVKSFDIGLMPLNVNDPFLKGKCAFKAIEYMAVGSPVVASAVGANIGAIRHGATGYLVQEPAEWELFLRNLVTDKSLRLEMGRAARTRVTGQYSVHHVLPMYVDLFTKTAPKITTKRK